MSITLWCPCARLHVHIDQPAYLSRDAAIALAVPVLVRCPHCGGKPAMVPASAEQPA